MSQSWVKRWGTKGENKQTNKHTNENKQKSYLLLSFGESKLKCVYFCKKSEGRLVILWVRYSWISNLRKKGRKKIMLCAFNINVAADLFLQINTYIGAQYGSRTKWLHSGGRDLLAERWTVLMEAEGEAWLAIQQHA